ncbi:MAG TPA: hypothetical protein VM326_03460 [Sphingomicrobium sp.]|jgi:hypothetical protein|nr:hypothetical protein [Sphingomicrobium sp.]
MLSIALAVALAAQAPVIVPEPPSDDPLIVAEPPPPCCLLRALTPVFLNVDEPLASDEAAIGQYFKLSLRQPLEIAAGVTIPAGTTGAGQVVHAAKSRAMGKAGELVLAARHLDFAGVRIPLRSLRYGSGQGKDNAETAAIVGIAVSALITPFITGGEVRIPAGTEVWAKVAADVAIPPSAAVPEAAAVPDPTQVPAKGVN